MSHHIYHTDAFILAGQNTGEANRSVFTFTRELGFVRATAQGARLLASKLRYGLQDFSLTHLGLVRGRAVWRLTSAVAFENFHSTFALSPEKRALVAHIFSLLVRLLQGEEANVVLFDMIRDGFSFLSTLTHPDDIAVFESLLVLRILRELGYVGESTHLDPLLMSGNWDTTILERMVPHRRIAISIINTSLKESHL